MLLKHSLRGRITLISVFFLVLGLFINSAIHTMIVVSTYSSGLIDRAHVLANSLKYKIDRLLQFHIPLKNLLGFETQCREITDSYNDISYALVIDPEGSILFHSDPALEGAQFPIPGEKPAFDEHAWNALSVFTLGGIENVAIPVYDLDQSLAGAVIVGYPQKLVTDRIAEMTLNSLLLTLILSGVMIFFLIMMLTSWVTRPLSNLMGAIEGMRGSRINGSESLPVATSDEIGKLSKAFSNLLGEVTSSQEELKKHAAELEGKVRERTYELNNVNNNLMAHIAALEEAKEEEKRLHSQLARSQKLEAIGNLASGVAHDLNNILSGLVNYPELLLMEMPPDSPYIKPITSIKRSGERAAAMVQDLLTLARRGVALCFPININLVASEFVKSAEYNALLQQFPRVRVNLELEEGLPNIIGTPFHITKLLMNLVTNSAEAIVGDGEITISTETCLVETVLKGYETIPPGRYVMLRVSDAGVGIAPEHIERIFEPFYTKKVLGRRSGTGLGLAVVYSTIKDHKGYIDVKSAAGEGTTISLYFYPTVEEAMVTEQELPVEQYNGKGERILVVDDLKEQRAIVESILVKLGYSPLSVGSGEEAVEYCREHAIDLIILDMIMDPGIDGLETYRRIAAIRPGQKAIITSGFTETARVLAMQELGAGAFVKKPYSIERLGLAIKEELQRVKA